MTADVLFAGSLAAQMRAAALAVLSALTGDQRAQAALPADDGARRPGWSTGPRRGPARCLAGLSIPARKAAHRLLATGLSDHAFAQALTITALEEVPDWREQGQLGLQRRLLGGGLRRPRVRRALVVAVRGPPRVGDDDRGR